MFRKEKHEHEDDDDVLCWCWSWLRRSKKWICRRCEGAVGILIIDWTCRVWKKKTCQVKYEHSARKTGTIHPHPTAKMTSTKHKTDHINIPLKCLNGSNVLMLNISCQFPFSPHSDLALVHLCSLTFGLKPSLYSHPKHWDILPFLILASVNHLHIHTQLQILYIHCLVVFYSSFRTWFVTLLWSFPWPQYSLLKVNLFVLCAPTEHLLL